MAKAEKKKHRKKRRTGLIVRNVICILAIAVLVFVLLFLLLFRIENIIVTGNERYTDEEIESYCMDGNDSFNNTVIFCMKNKEIKIEDVPLLDSVEVSYVNRNTIMLSANEKITIGMFKSGNRVYCFDQDGIVVETVDYSESGGLDLPLIYGLSSSGGAIEADEGVLNTLHALMNSYEKYEIMPETVYVDKAQDGGTDSEEGGVYTFTLNFGEVEVLLGKDEYLEEKMRRVAVILPKLEGKSGTLHLETYNEDTKNIVFDSNSEENG